eukprot:Gb_37550 [translate_table: standard]
MRVLFWTKYLNEMFSYGMPLLRRILSMESMRKLLCSITKCCRKAYSQTISPFPFYSKHAVTYRLYKRGKEIHCHIIKMQLAEVRIDSIAIVSVLQACSHVRALKEGKEIHKIMIRTGLDSDVFVETTLMHMYAKCRSGHARETLALFNRMQLIEITPGSITIVSALQPCTHLASVTRSVEVSRQLFDILSKRNVVLWSAMIAGYAKTGHVNEALTLFHEMHFTNVNPNSVTIVTVLQECTHLTSFKEEGKWIPGCIIRRGFETDVFVVTALIDMHTNHAGLVNEGCQYFEFMIQNYNMVDLLERATHLDELGELVAGCLFDLMPQKVGYYILLSNTYTTVGRWNGVEKMGTMMNERGVKTIEGNAF